MIALLLARRYLLASRKEAQVGVVALAAFVGLALGVAALVVSLALLAGCSIQYESSAWIDPAHGACAPPAAAIDRDPPSGEAGVGLPLGGDHGKAVTHDAIIDGLERGA